MLPRLTHVLIVDCWHCGRAFASPRKAQATVCSEACRAGKRATVRRRGKDRRRALKRAAYVANVIRAQVYERDGWRCHLCGKPLARTKVVPHPKAPTIDHIVPLARGGTHEPLNVRAAHYLCNSVKGDRGGGEQMLMFA